MNITFVVLHYNNNEDTKKCVESLLPYLNSEKYTVNIVIVDNGSPQQKAKDISGNFLKNKNIHLIEARTNIGFAKGNNLGYRYAKEKLHSDVIVLANNDLLFKQKNFLSVINEEVVKQKIDIAGPRILLQDSNINENPVPRQFNSRIDIESRIIKDRILLIGSYIFGIDTLISRGVSSSIKDNTLLQEKNNYQLHGACLIFANRYVKEKNGLYDGTFMYGEENILRYMADVYSYKMLYIDHLFVIHKEGGSTKGSYANSAKKRRFRYKNGIRSNKLLLNLINNGFPKEFI